MKFEIRNMGQKMVVSSSKKVFAFQKSIFPLPKGKQQYVAYRCYAGAITTPHLANEPFLSLALGQRQRPKNMV